MNESKNFDYIVVGAGIEGSATAYWLAKHSHKILLLEQFRLPHTRGSSHGGSRITRRAYEDELYVQMANEAFPMWDQLEKESGEELYRKTGLLVMASESTDYVQSVVEAMGMHGAPFTFMNATEINKRYPLMNCEKDWIGVTDDSGGILRANRCLAAFHREFVKSGGTLLENVQVIEIIPDGSDGVKVETLDHVTFRCKRVILCMGSWSGLLLEKLNYKLPLQPKTVKPCYWKEKNPGEYSANGNFPCFFVSTADGRFIYGMPADEYPGLIKIAAHEGVDIPHADFRDSVNTDRLIELPRAYIKSHLKNVMTEPSIVESCIYTETPDESFILDKLPINENIIIGAGFSGHGFKFAPVVGKILGSLALGIDTEYDLTKFSCERFKNL